MTEHVLESFSCFPLSGSGGPSSDLRKCSLLNITSLKKRINLLTTLEKHTYVTHAHNFRRSGWTTSAEVVNIWNLCKIKIFAVFANKLIWVHVGSIIVVHLHMLVNNYAIKMYMMQNCFIKSNKYVNINYATLASGLKKRTAFDTKDNMIYIYIIVIQKTNSTLKP